MAVLNCLVSKTFMSLELFLQKAAGLDIFEGLIFKYKVKIDLLEPLSIHFLAVLKEFASQLQYVVEETTLQKQEQFENINHNLNESVVDQTCASSIDDNLPLKGRHSVGTETDQIKTNTDILTYTDCQPKLDASPKQAQVKKRYKSQGKKLKLSKNQLEKGKEDLFKTLSSLKVESVFEEVKNTFVNTEQPLSVDDSDVQTFLPGLEPELQDLFKCDESNSQPVPDNLPFYCCITCLEVYKSFETYEKHWCQDGETNDGTEESERHRRDSSCGDTANQLVRPVERLRAMKSFRCGLCREEYRSYDRIAYHLPRCGGGPFHCELCLQEYRFRRDLNAHKKKAHRREKCFICEECGVSFFHRTSLQKHQVNRHEQGQTTFACDRCPEQFGKRINLTNHSIKVHKLEKRFLCQICGKKFFTQGSLQVHLEIHSEPGKFSCAYCAKKFQQKEKLLFHTRIHTGERPHLCQTCGKCFIRKSKLDEHMRRHRGEKRFACPLCGKCYAGNWDLKLHTKKQHSATPSEAPDPAVPKQARSAPRRPRVARARPEATGGDAEKPEQVPPPPFYPLGLEGGEGAQRIVLVDQLVAPPSGADGAARVVLLEGADARPPAAVAPSRLYLQLGDLPHPPVYALGEGAAAQYVQLGAGGGENALVQFPVPQNALAQPAFPALHAAQPGIVFASGFADLNGLAYVEKVVEDYR